ncbi:MAG: nucleoside-triphosphatase [Nitrospirota bacterium]
MNILITGAPGAGKTTLIQRVAAKIPEARGFYTEEIREGGRRKGFRLVGLPGGGERVLAHVDIQSPRRVSKYGVDVEGFEEFLGGLDLGGATVVIVDEVGKMECFSGAFRSLIAGLLGTEEKSSHVVATIARRGTPFIEELKKKARATMLEVTEGNRDALVGVIMSMLE